MIHANKVPYKTCQYTPCTWHHLSAWPSLDCIYWPSDDIELLNYLCHIQLKRGATQHDEAGDDLCSPSPKKQRRVWTPEAHQKFRNIVEGLGDSKQTCQPRSICTRRVQAAAWRYDVLTSKVHENMRPTRHIFPLHQVQSHVQGLSLRAFWT